MRSTVALFAGLLLTFGLGAVTGYAARTVSAPSTNVAHAAACPSGTHAVVWYTVKAWACVPNS